MANLVEPVNILEPIEERIIEFKGLDRKTVVEDGEMQMMQNMTSDNYPVLSPRKPRGGYDLPPGAVKPLKIMERFERIAMIAKKANGSIAFFYHLTEVTNVTGLTEDTEMVAINNKICFFPQKTYLEIVRTGSVVATGNYGNLEASSTLSNAEVTLSNEDVRIRMHTETMAADYAYDDAVTINGTLSFTDARGDHHDNVPALASCIIEEVDGKVLILPRETFIELTGEGATNITLTGTISRTMPDLDYVIEWNNRLWGVSNVANTIYACKLGDPKNWQYFQATSLDSYYAEQGTDEDWTGCAAYSNHLIFFKQNSMARIYGTAPSNWQLANAKCYGVEAGSGKSIVVINDRVFYKSTIGIMAYDGGIPYCISDKFNDKFNNVVAGTEGRKYYASCHFDWGNPLMVLDTEKAMWHVEDELPVEDCCTMDGRLYIVTSGATTDTGKIVVINPSTPTETYADYEWSAVFGPFDEYIENRKIYSKVLIRLLALENNTRVKVRIALDDAAIKPTESNSLLIADFNPASKEGEFIPVVPRRCDKYSIIVEGKGNVQIKSLTRRIRKGTGGKL